MEVRVRRKNQTANSKSKAKNSPEHGESVELGSHLTEDQQSSSTAGVHSVLRRTVTWLKQSALLSWLHHAVLTLKQSIMRNQSWPVVLVQVGLWLLLLWLLSNLHMGLPCFLLALVFWIYNMYGGGPPLSTLTERRQEQRGH